MPSETTTTTTTTPETPAPATTRLADLDESNSLPKEVQKLLRKKAYQYQYAEAAIKEVNTRHGNRPEGTEPMPYREKKKQIDFRNKLILAPLTTIGNLPFRRICKEFGADITIGEMALGSNLLQGKFSEWALCKRHESEDVFGIQIAANYVDQAARVTELLNAHTDADFIDLNCGCPVEAFYLQGLGSGLLNRVRRLADSTYY
jgi:tRNA-dihydrouridine synthase 3